jgi:hypothetical protein
MVDQMMRRRGSLGTGRPPLLDEKARETLLTAIRAGNRLSVAARFAGVSPNTVDEWLRRGQGLDDRPPTPRYVRFYEDVTRAKAEAEVWAVAQLRRGMVDSPSAAIWWLRNTSAEWRQDLAPPVIQPGPVTNVTIESGVVVLTEREVAELARKRLQEQRSEGADDGDALRARRARLVSDSAD